MTRCLAIIPARGGSKRIPKKNIKYFCGQSIIKYSIDAAIMSKCFDEVMVSTDDTEIAKVVENLGAKVPFFRSERNASDHAVLADVVLEVILEYKKRGKEFKFFCCILPAAPLISHENLIRGFEMLVKSGADSVMPVVRFGYPIQRALKMEDNKLSMVWPENLNVRSQDLTDAYHDSGQFYWVRVDVFLKYGSFFTKNTSAFELSESEVQDIDVAEDWKQAEIKYNLLKNLC